MEKIDKYLVENEIKISLQILENQYDTKNKVINLKKIIKSYYLDP